MLLHKAFFKTFVFFIILMFLMFWWFWNVIRFIVIVKINNMYAKGDVSHSRNSWWQPLCLGLLEKLQCKRWLLETDSCWASSNVLNCWIHAWNISELQIKQILYTRYKLAEFFLWIKKVHLRKFSIPIPENSCWEIRVWIFLYCSLPLPVLMLDV